MIRVVVIGARRRHQGIGEFVAQRFAEAGAEVCAVVGTSSESAGEARDHLSREYGIQCRAYRSVPAALSEERPDLVAICSPYRFHHEQLQQVAEAGVHCLCEKPLWWDETLEDHGPATREIVRRFVDQDLLLRTVTQWPCTLTAFAELYPEVARQTLSRFEMWLSPDSLGARQIPDAAPHLISMLQALAGAGRVERAEVHADDAGNLDLRCAYVHGGGKAEVKAQFRRCEKPPRPAAFAINGQRVDRTIEMPGYRFHLEAGSQRVPLADPLAELVSGTIQDLEADKRTDGPALIAASEALDCFALREKADRG